VLGVEVRDDGPGPGGAETPGYGLLGMRERVTAAGGTVRAGARDDGLPGFAVVVSVPLVERDGDPRDDAPRAGDASTSEGVDA
jgi:glucose-6-phosphate-specific signal transduction histidine kinase